MKYILYTLFLLFALTSCKTKKIDVQNKNKIVDIQLKFNNIEKRIKEIQKNNLSLKESDKLINLLRDEQISIAIENENNNDIDFSSEEIDYLKDQIVNNAVDNIGCRYQIGGTTKSGFDCSGLIYSTYKKFGYTLPRTSLEMSKYGKGVSNDEYKKRRLNFL